jgi:hypothetical protein
VTSVIAVVAQVVALGTPTPTDSRTGTAGPTFAVVVLARVTDTGPAVLTTKEKKAVPFGESVPLNISVVVANALVVVLDGEVEESFEQADAVTRAIRSRVRRATRVISTLLLHHWNGLRQKRDIEMRGEAKDTGAITQPSSQPDGTPPGDIRRRERFRRTGHPGAPAAGVAAV